MLGTVYVYYCVYQYLHMFYTQGLSTYLIVVLIVQSTYNSNINLYIRYVTGPSRIFEDQLLEWLHQTITYICFRDFGVIVEQPNHGWQL